MTEHQLVDPSIKYAIYHSQNGLCALCGECRTFSKMTVDHIIPLSRGGKDEMKNMQCVCKRCNIIKGNMLPMEFSRYMNKVFMNNLKSCELQLQRIN